MASSRLDHRYGAELSLVTGFLGREAASGGLGCHCGLRVKFLILHLT
jgi:hypothetical protein